DRPVVTLHGQREETGLSKGERLTVGAFPFVCVTVVATVRRVENDEDAGLLNSLPEGVELGQCEGTRPSITPGGCGPHQDRPGPVLHDEIQLFQRSVYQSRSDDRCREDAV